MSRYVDGLRGGTNTPAPEIANAAVDGILWAMDSNNVWHVLPYTTIKNEWFFCPRLGPTKVEYNVTFPPKGATLCPECRGHYTSRIVEGE